MAEQKSTEWTTDVTGNVDTITFGPGLLNERPEGWGQILYWTTVGGQPTVKVWFVDPTTMTAIVGTYGLS